MKVGILLVFGVLCVVGMFVDMIASVFGLIAWLNADYWVAKLLIGCTGIIVRAAFPELY